MRKLYAGILLIGMIFSLSSFGNSDPCFPDYRALPSQLTCPTRNGLIADVEIQTLMTDPRKDCPFEKRREKNTAYVKFYDKDGKQHGNTMILRPGQFTYHLGLESDGWIRSRRLNLNHCISPENGGISFGN